MGPITVLRFKGVSDLSMAHCSIKGAKTFMRPVRRACTRKINMALDGMFIISTCWTLLKA